MIVCCGYIYAMMCHALLVCGEYGNSFTTGINEQYINREIRSCYWLYRFALQPNVCGVWSGYFNMETICKHDLASVLWSCRRRQKKVSSPHISFSRSSTTININIISYVGETCSYDPFTHTWIHIYHHYESIYIHIYSMKRKICHTLFIPYIYIHIIYVYFKADFLYSEIHIITYVHIA